MEAPLYSIELRKLRADISIVEMARLCGVHRESIRQTENGKIVPSNEFLFRWLSVVGLQPSDRPDILRSVVQQRIKTNQVVAETEALRDLTADTDEPLDIDGVVRDVVAAMYETCPSLTEDMRLGQEVWVRKLLLRNKRTRNG